VLKRLEYYNFNQKLKNKNFLKMESKENYLKRMSDLREAIKKVDFSKLEIKPEDLKDPYCDPENPVKIDFEHVSAAAYRLKGGIEFTPCTVIY
jgi:hypothetical protein